MIDATLARTAHGDAWQVHGLIRTDRGGAVGELPGVRLMASGLPHPAYNNGDVHDVDAVDRDALERWYAERGAPWGVRVPADATWDMGRLLFRKRLMALDARDLVAADVPSGVQLRAATGSDLAAVTAVDAEAFGGEPATDWMAPLVETEPVDVALASVDGRPVGTGYIVRADGWAGPSGLLGGVAVVPDARRRGIAAALSSWLLARAFEGGVGFVVLNPDTDEAARVYARLGFVELDGFDVYVAE
ncbi:putative N-acetyltransferase YhbS [Diaminobutyricimonas aerilata]|uniref:Putative N-acetyltransferase YhbS n=1 Tax=Diaminobutyricimonas aerilata TaxID=1162967 RepID=A0A2M9CFG8_9MICO|nr:GNAT family N-acetyltransferase [Diaminobutyricimonas aerilata]PJJ70629.1 putative N-acetyltransferase YhbS [Diaminobutyricimonas aerilata]